MLHNNYFEHYKSSFISELMIHAEIKCGRTKLSIAATEQTNLIPVVHLCSSEHHKLELGDGGVTFFSLYAMK